MKRSVFLIPLLLIFSVQLVFWDVHDHDFVGWDDDTLIYMNPYLNPVTPAHITYFWQHPYQHLYMPLTYSVMALVAQSARLKIAAVTSSGIVSDLNPQAFHLTNLLIHLANVLLVFIILQFLLRNESRSSMWAAGAGALLFGVHPLQVESVAWAAEIKGLLCAFFSLMALWQYLRYAALFSDTRAINAQPASHKSYFQAHLNYTLATLCFGLALLCKPSAVALPLMAWALSYWGLRSTARSSPVPLVFWVFISTAWVVLTRIAQPVTEHDLVTPLWARPLIAGDALAFYLYKIAFPLQLGADYGRTPDYVLNHAWGYVAWLVPVTLAVCIKLWGGSSKSWLAASMGIFFAAVSPTLGFIPFAFQLYSTVADRYVYLAMLGPALALAWGMRQWLDHKHRKLAIGSCCIVLFLLSFDTMLQTLNWSNNFTLFQHMLEINPQSWNAHYNLAVTLDKAGHSSQAITHYQAALRINPNQANAHNNLGILLAAQGKTDEAVTHFKTALRLDPSFARAYANLGVVLSKQGKTSEAIFSFQQALQLDPELNGVRRLLRKAQTQDKADLSQMRKPENTR